MPNIAIAAILCDGVDNSLHGVDLVRPHHQELLLTCHQNHIAAYGLAERAFDKEGLGEAIEMDDLLVVDIGEFVNREKPLLGVERKMSCVVVSEIECPIAVADNEELQKTQDCLGIAVPGVILVVDDLLHGATWAYAESLQFDLNDWHSVDQENDIVPMMAVVRVDA